MRVVVLIFWVLGAAIGVSRAGTLEIHFSGPDGRPVQISKASLLLKGWGFAMAADLSTSRDSLTIPTDFAWLKAQFPELELEPKRHIQFRVLLEAQGFVTLQSGDFFWPGSVNAANGTLRPAVAVRFPDGQYLVLDMNSETSGEIRFRRAGARRIRLVDEHHTPVSGVTVRVYRHWSSENHCGHLGGSELLVEAPSDFAGFVRIPDGDFEYAILIPDWKDFLLLEHNCCDYTGWVTYLEQETTDIVLHRFEVRPLRMRILRNDRPAAGISLWGVRRYCDGGTCGVCDGILAVSDERGRIDLEKFRPEAVKELWILKSDKGEPTRENILWRADPIRFAPGSTVRVDLAHDALD